jgi:hypothetical protein
MHVAFVVRLRAADTRMKTSPLLPMLLQLATLQRLVLAQPVSAAAAAAAATTFGFGRFTVVSDSLIRLELGTDAAGVALWDDRPTLSYPGGRPSAQAAHTVAHPSADVLTIATSQLLLRYDRSASPGGAFTNASLSITLTAADAGGSGATVWRPGLQNPGNLRGTRLDIGCYATFESCYSNGLSPGPLSTSGWSVMDDTVRGSALRPRHPTSPTSLFNQNLSKVQDVRLVMRAGRCPDGNRGRSRGWLPVVLRHSPLRSREWRLRADAGRLVLLRPRAPLPRRAAGLRRRVWQGQPAAKVCVWSVVVYVV